MNIEKEINPSSEKTEIDAELECVICNDILFQPVSINCGHSYCKQCLINILRTKPSCPVCRTPTFLQENNLKQNVILQNIIEHKYPEHVKRRKAEMVTITEENTISGTKEPTERIPISLPPILTFNTPNDRDLLPETISRITFHSDWSLELFFHICPDKRVVLLNTAHTKFPKVTFVLEILKVEKRSPHENVAIVRVHNRILVKELQQIECDTPELLEQFKLQQPIKMTVARAEEYLDDPIADVGKLEEGLQHIREFLKVKVQTIAHNSPHALAELVARFPTLTQTNLLLQRPFEQLSNETLMLVSLLNMEHGVKHRLVETKNIMERLAILQHTISQLETYNESTKLFDILGHSGHKSGIMNTIIPFLIIIAALIFFKIYK